MPISLCVVGVLMFVAALAGKSLHQSPHQSPHHSLELGRQRTVATAFHRLKVYEDRVQSIFVGHALPAGLGFHATHFTRFQSRDGRV
jgi:hypothetical protein